MPGKSVGQALKRIAQSRRSPSEIQLAVAKYKAGVQSAQEVLPIYPNPGSQAYLMFDVLGFKKGKEKIVHYPPESTKDAIAIIEKEGISYPYAEVLKDEAIAYELLPPDKFAPKETMVNLHCGNGVGKTAISLAIAYIMTLINPKGKGLISANTYPQLEKSTIPAMIEMCQRFSIPFGTAREPNRWSGKTLNDAEIMSAAKSIAHYEKGMVINGCYHYVLSADNFMGGSSKRAQSGRGLQVGWVILDEYARTPDASAFQAVVTRVRQKGSEPLIVLPSTINTDNPFNWVYEIFDNPGRSMEQRAGKISIEGSTIENRHNNASSYVRNMYGSMPKPMFLAEVFGKYIEIAENRLIEEAWIEAALTIQLYSAPPPLMGDEMDRRKRSGLDVANSTNVDKGDASVLTVLVDSTVTEIHEFKLDTYDLANEVDKYMRENRISSVCYDAAGLGVGTGNNLTHIGDRRYRVVAANGSRAASSDEVVKDFRGNPVKLRDFLYNERAELGWRLRERFKKTYAMMTGAATYPDAELISIPNHPELLRQLRAMKFLQKNGKIILIPKEEVIRQLGRSPDHYDSLTYALANAATSDYSDLGWIGDVYG